MIATQKKSSFTIYHCQPFAKVVPKYDTILFSLYFCLVLGYQKMHLNTKNILFETEIVCLDPEGIVRWSLVDRLKHIGGLGGAPRKIRP